jgi:hypothetical protein
MMFRFVAVIVFFIACVFHTLDFYRVPASNGCEVHTGQAGFSKTKTEYENEATDGGNNLGLRFGLHISVTRPARLT